MSDISPRKFSNLSSIFAKCLAITAVTGIVIACLISVNAYKLSVSVVTEVIDDVARGTNQLIADNLAEPLAQAGTEQIRAVMSEFMSRGNGIKDGAIVLHADGRELFISDGISNADKDALTILANAALATGAAQENIQTLDSAIPIRDTSGALNAVVAFDWSTAKVEATIQRKLIIDIAISAGFLAIMLLGSTFLLIHFLRKPMRELETAVQKVANGDLDTMVAGTHRADEVGVLARNLEKMRESLAEGRNLAADQAEKQKAEQRVIGILRHALKKLSGGDLTTVITAELTSEYRDLGRDFNETASTFHDAMGKVVMLAERIRTESQEIGRHSDDLSQRTENQAATLEETAAALDDLTNGVRGAADGAREVEGIVSTARTEATKSGEIVRKTINAMSEIERSSSQISAIIAVIDDIAFQTNLLALNAGVEAARAGDAGRGFAVVAAEVRALAQRSSEAAQEIKSLITGSSAHVSNGVKLVADAGTALTGITDRVVQIAVLMSDMANNAQEQSTNLNEINIGVGNLDQVTQRNAGMVEAANAASMALLGQSKALSDLVINFKIGQGTAAPLLLDQRVA